jgi:5-methylcytosine-specific restriction endonuclease McrA
MAGSDIGPNGLCAQCGKAVPQTPGPGRPKKYCSAQCAKRAALNLASSAKRAKTLAERPAVSHCQRCATPMPVGRRGKVPLACSACRFALYREAQGEELRARARERQLARERASGVVPFEQFQRERTRASIERRTSVCGSCGVGFVAKRLERLSYCSRQCAGEAKKTRPPAHSRVWFPTCRECDRVFATRLEAVRVCSNECKAAEARRSARIRAAASVVPLKLRCPECDSEFVRTYGDKGRAFCSQPCSKRHSARASRKKRKWVERAARVETVNPFKVFKRDGWRCQCCRKPTPRDKRGTYHPRAPELDHIVPVSKGGEHSYRNTQLLCRACNGAKSDTDGGQQMRLFG